MTAKPLLRRALPALPALLVSAALFSQTEAASARSMGDSGAVGTHPTEYRANTQKAMGASSSGAASGNTTSTGRERTGPGAQPGEYDAAGTKAPAAYDTVRNVRVKPDTTTSTGRAWQDSVRGGTGPTKPGGSSPRPNAPKTPTEMPGSGTSAPSVPGSGPGSGSGGSGPMR